jgi:C-terminal peptidase prc
MRRTFTGFMVLILATPVWAVNPGEAPRSTPQLRAQAQAYANQIVQFTDYVVAHYYQPITHATLLKAALAGLYEAEREPLPAGLRDDLVGAKSASDRVRIVAAARERLGNADAIQGQKGLTLSVQALSRALDPYSGVPGPHDRRSFGADGYFGLGLELESEGSPAQMPLMELDRMPQPPGGTHRGPVRIVDVLPGGPAQRAGVHPGDLITQIDGQDLSGSEAPTLLQRLTLSEFATGKVALTLRRGGGTEPIRLDLSPELFMPENVFGVNRKPDNSWNFLIDAKNQIGYVRLGFIDLGAPEEMRAALTDLQAAKVRGLILDLRGCPGGFVDPAVKICGMFLRSKTVAKVDSKVEGTKRHVTHETTGTPFIEGLPIIVLVDGETRGGGEMLAAAFQDHKICLVSGQRSFGKGSVQGPTDAANPLPVEFKLTTGMFTRPSGKNLHRFPNSRMQDDWGVRPDSGLEFPVSPEMSKQLKEWMRQLALRPGSSKEVLPLDDPERDPVRQLALRELSKQLRQRPSIKIEPYILALLSVPAAL